MKQLMRITAAVAIMMYSTVSMAQVKKSADDKVVRLSVGIETGLPVGKFNTGTKWNLGGSVQADFSVVKRVLFITANAGYNNFFTEKSTKGDLQLIPVKAGLKYFPVNNLYIQGEAGVSFLANKSKIDADKSASFVYAPQVGYLIPLGRGNYLDAGIRFESNSKFYEKGNQANFLGLRIAYAFDTK
jgi:hypothetical protein